MPPVSALMAAHNQMCHSQNYSVQGGSGQPKMVFARSVSQARLLVTSELHTTSLHSFALAACGLLHRNITAVICLTVNSNQ